MALGSDPKSQLRDLDYLAAFPRNPLNDISKAYNSIAEGPYLDGTFQCRRDFLNENRCRRLRRRHLLLDEPLHVGATATGPGAGCRS